MPALYAHRHFGALVLSQLPQPLQENLRLHETAFALGTQGPDILFYHKPFAKNEIKEKGMALHLRSAKTFFERAAKLTAEKGEKSALAAYVVGFICHFALDNACHPHVYAAEYKGGNHGRIESEFDKHLKKKNGEKVHRNAGKEMRDKDGTALACAELLEVDVKPVRRAIKTMRFINGLFSCPNRFFHRVAHAVLRKMGAEEKFGGMFLHFKNEPYCDAVNPALTTAFENAIAPTAALVTQFINQAKSGDFAEEFFSAFDKDYKGEK